MTILKHVCRALHVKRRDFVPRKGGREKCHFFVGTDSSLAFFVMHIYSRDNTENLVKCSSLTLMHVGCTVATLLQGLTTRVPVSRRVIYECDIRAFTSKNGEK